VAEGLRLLGEAWRNHAIIIVHPRMINQMRQLGKTAAAALTKIFQPDRIVYLSQSNVYRDVDIDGPDGMAFLEAEIKRRGGVDSVVEYYQLELDRLRQAEFHLNVEPEDVKRAITVCEWIIYHERVGTIVC
jgi:hypothetical protein